VRRLRDSLWIGPTFAAVFAIGVCAVAYWIGNRYDANVDLTVTEDTLITVLALFASSMLTVATFSLQSIATSAGSVSASTTPRAAVHVVTDARGRVAVASFIAAFVYAVVGILSLVALEFGELGRLMLFVGLIMIVAIVLLAFITWVDQVLKLGRQQFAVARLLENARRSLTPGSAYAFGALAWDEEVPDGAAPVHHERVGRILTVDTVRAQEIADANDVHLVLTVRPGDTVEPTVPVAWVVADDPSTADEVATECARDIRSVFDLELQRSQDQDVRFNVLMLGETADRALSPGVNDPGTAIVVLDLLLSFFVDWCGERREAVAKEVHAPRVRMPVLHADQLVNDAFGPIARDGASIVEVGIRMQKVLAAMTRLGDPELAEAARSMSRTALGFARPALHDEQRRRVEAAAPPGVTPVV
jgi:uncharacterized membrane protein